MLYRCEVSYRFFEHITFSDADLEPDSEDGQPTSEVLAELEKDFTKAVHDALSTGRWGRVDWVEVDVGDDNDDYEDSTQIEYFFRAECLLTEQEVEKDADSRVITRPVLRITQDAVNKLKSELQESLGQTYNTRDAWLETTEPKPKDA